LQKFRLGPRGFSLVGMYAGHIHDPFARFLFTGALFGPVSPSGGSKYFVGFDHRLYRFVCSDLFVKKDTVPKKICMIKSSVDIVNLFEKEAAYDLLYYPFKEYFQVWV